VPAVAQEAVYDLLFEILEVVKPEYLQIMSASNLWEELGPNLLHSYVVMVLLAFLETGLVEVCVCARVCVCVTPMCVAGEHGPLARSHDGRPCPGSYRVRHGRGRVQLGGAAAAHEAGECACGGREGIGGVARQR
jgi:hypothetical protein